MPRVLWLTSHYPHPADPVTGIFFRTQARALVRSNLSLRVVAPTPFAPGTLAKLSTKWSRYHATPQAQTDEGVDVVYPRYLATPQQMRFGMADRFIATAARASSDFTSVDLIHAHYVYPEGLAAVRLGREFGKPVVVTLHGDDVNTYPYQDRLALQRFTATVGGADHLLAVSDALVDRTTTISGRRPVMAPIGIDLRPYSNLPSRTVARDLLSLDDQTFVALYLGHLGERKGMAELAASLGTSGLTDVLCLVVGEGPMRSYLEGRPNVRLEGRVPNEHVPTYLAAADVLVLPSHEEGTPTVVIEAGAAKLPVIASTVGGIPKLLDCDRGLLIAPRSVPALVDALLAVRADPTQARWRAHALHDHVLDTYDVDKNARDLLETYSRVVRSRMTGNVVA